jgi:hypothetical protein
MKKQALLVVTVVLVFAVLFSLVPLSNALAKKDPVNVPITVRNRTGGKVFLTLIDADGNRLFFEYTPGLFETLVLEGNYKYYASLPCGNQAGEFNLNRGKELYFACGDGLEISLTVPTGPEILETPIPTPTPLVCPTFFSAFFSFDILPQSVNTCAN